MIDAPSTSQVALRYLHALWFVSCMCAVQQGFLFLGPLTEAVLLHDPGNDSIISS
ncbi:hypothetical protein NEOLEDRAFT_1133485 [Neolentinus lepideus HHB14362 ss-1]|uniref:Uncharacterized protein n=1 Tax=Neolentinus lepideus HHB14362 ss-1 TaxID=1314782 RepID=A0A165SQI0_9AGAM|nr:hypothetical protein NEOLEDRAFT_1133485 [Neolentinus lepideus HHB14362 ss-1]